MNIDTDEEGYIVSIMLGSDDESNERFEEVAAQLYDSYRRPQWKLIDGLPIRVPQEPRSEDLETVRKKWVVSEIRKRYTISNELKLQREYAMAEHKPTVDMLRYHRYVESVIAESHRRYSTSSEISNPEEI